VPLEDIGVWHGVEANRSILKLGLGDAFKPGKVQCMADMAKRDRPSTVLGVVA
jgi:hypothetical protein